jgi:hypothetical protein
MPCFVLGYVGSGLSVRQLLSCGDRLVPRTRHSYGLALWAEFGEKADLHVRDHRSYPFFRSELGEEGAVADGPVAAALRERGLGMSSMIVKKALLHGRFPTSGIHNLLMDSRELTAEEIETARLECHPFLHTYQGISVYAIHNGMYQGYEQRFDSLRSEGFEPVVKSDSAVCCASLSAAVAKMKSEKLGAEVLFQELEQNRGSGAVVYTSSLSPQKIFGLRQGSMPLCAVISQSGLFLASDISIVAELDDEEVEVYCMRNGGIVESNNGTGFKFANLASLGSSAHFGRLKLRKSRLKDLEMQSCRTTQGWAHDERLWDLRTNARWAIWPEEELCLICASEKAEMALGGIPDGAAV